MRAPEFCGTDTINGLFEPVVRAYHRDLPLTVHIEHSIKADVLALLIEHGYNMEPDGETGYLVITRDKL